MIGQIGRASRAAIGLALLCGSAAAPAATHALLVGIGTYKNAGQGEFRNLKGATADVAAMRSLLHEKYSVPSDRMTVMLDAQATRDAILTSLKQSIERAQAGDQLLFYFSGHGALVSEGFAGGGDETDRVDETIVPYDSRGPDGVKDIRDDELRQFIAAATRKGINFVSIFDSCNSGSATRGVRNVASRSAPAAKVDGAIPAVQPVTAAPAARPGFQVHLASARDGEVALEAEQDGRWRGDFTAALVTALTKLPAGASYRDLLGEVRLQLTEAGLVSQHPRGEGELNRGFLANAPVQRRLFPLQRSEDGWQLQGGTIAGVVPGSQFAIYANATEAASKGATPLTTATVTSATTSTAMLSSIQTGLLRSGTLYARELERQFAPGSVKIALTGTDPSALSALRQAFASYPSIEANARNPQLVLVADGPQIRIESPDGARLTEFLASNASTAAKSIGSYYALLQLRDGGQPPDIDLSLQSVRCSDSSCSSPQPAGAAPVDPAGEYRFRPGDCFRPMVQSSEPKARNVYLLHLGSDFAVTLVYPGQNETAESDSLLGPRKPLTVPSVFCMSDQPGRDYFMLFATDKPIDLSVLQQDALRDASTPLDPLSRLLSNARHATRGATASVPVDQWGVRVVSAFTDVPAKGN